MNKEEIRHFKSILREASFRHMNILLDDKLQKELQTIIKDYEQLQQENKRQKEVINKAIEYIRNHQLVFRDHTTEEIDKWFNQFYIDLLDILKEVG